MAPERGRCVVGGDGTTLTAVRGVFLVGVVSLCCVLSLSAAAAGELVVASGQFGQMPWALSASDSPSGSYCLTMRTHGHVNARSCGSIFGGRAHGVSYLASEGPPRPNFIAGPVIAKAVSVRITFLSGRLITVRTHAPPPGLSRNVRFYVHLMQCVNTRPAQIAGLDAGGPWKRMETVVRRASRARCANARAAGMRRSSARAFSTSAAAARCCRSRRRSAASRSAEASRVALASAAADIASSSPPSDAIDRSYRAGDY